MIEFLAIMIVLFIIGSTKNVKTPSSNCKTFFGRECAQSWKTLEDVFNVGKLSSEENVWKSLEKDVFKENIDKESNNLIQNIAGGYVQINIFSNIRFCTRFVVCYCCNLKITC